MKQLFIAILTVLCFSQVYSQNFDFGKVSKAELQENVHPKDSSASAAVLYKSEKVSFYFAQNQGFMQQREIHERIKIYNKEGFDWATKKVYLYQGSGGSNESVSGLKGYSFNLENGKIVKDKLGKEGKFEEDYSESTKISSFTMPSVKEGTVIEYRYTIESPFFGIDDVIFQYSIPINKLDVRVATPEYYVYSKQQNLKATFLPNVKTSSSRTSVPFEYKTNILSVNEVDIPALTSEAYSGNINNYRSKMSMEITAILNQDKIVTKSFSANWEEVSKTIYDNSSFGGQMDKFNFYKDDLNALLAGVEDDLEKAHLVENLVKSKVKWNGSYGKYAQKGIKSAYKEGVGNDADINLLVISMLRSKGVNAYPVLISTRNNGIPLFPTREGFNYVICMVKSNGESLLIDATEKYASNNVLPQRVLNWQGRLIEDNGVSSWVNIKPNKKSLEATMLNVKLDEDLTATGKVAKSLNSYLALSYRNKYATMTNDDHIKSLEDGKGNMEISELDFKNAKEIDKPVKVSYQYELSDGIDEVGDKLYFSPLLFLTMKENPFKLEERKYPIDFVIPYQDKYIVNIMLPEGYTTESLPQSEAIAFKDNDAVFKYILKQNGNYLQLKVELNINQPFVQSLDYKDFKAFFSKIVEKQTEQVVLTKA